MNADWRRHCAVQEAARLLAQHGYEGLRTAEVARAMDVSPGTLFRYFTSKRELSEAVLTDTYQQARHALVAAVASRRLEGAQALKALWQALCNLAHSHRDALAFAELHWHPPRADGRPAWRGLLSVVEEALGALAERRAPWLPARDAAPLLWGAFLAVFRREAAGERVEAWAYANALYYVAESILPPSRLHLAPASRVSERDLDVDEEGEPLPEDEAPSAEEVAAADASCAQTLAGGVTLAPAPATAPCPDAAAQRKGHALLTAGASSAASTLVAASTTDVEASTDDDATTLLDASTDCDASTHVEASAADGVASPSAASGALGVTTPGLAWPRDEAGVPLGRRWREVQEAFVDSVGLPLRRPLLQRELALLTTKRALRVVASVCDSLGLLPGVSERDVRDVLEVLGTPPAAHH